jgi:hypothetical protein
MALLIGAFLVLMLIGVPVAVSMAVASVLYLVIYGVAPDIIVAQRMIAGVESFPLLAVPFFILGRQSDERRRGHRPHLRLRGRSGRLDEGGLGAGQHHRLGIFSGMSGTRWRMRPPDRHHRDQGDEGSRLPVEAAVGVTAGLATLGPIFPPSLPSSSTA